MRTLARFGKSQLLVSQCGQLVRIGDAVDGINYTLYAIFEGLHTFQLVLQWVSPGEAPTLEKPGWPSTMGWPPLLQFELEVVQL